MPIGWNSKSLQHTFCIDLEERWAKGPETGDDNNCLTRKMVVTRLEWWKLSVRTLFYQLAIMLSVSNAYPVTIQYIIMKSRHSPQHGSAIGFEISAVGAEIYVGRTQTPPFVVNMMNIFSSSSVLYLILFVVEWKGESDHLIILHNLANHLSLKISAIIFFNVILIIKSNDDRSKSNHLQSFNFFL